MNLILKQIISKTKWNLIGYCLGSLIKKAKEIKKETNSNDNSPKKSNETITTPWQYSQGLQRYERKRTSNPTGFIGKYGR